MMTTPLTAIVMVVLAMAVPPQATPPSETAAAEQVTVYRVKTCGCCGKWVEHLKAAGFAVTDHIVERRDASPDREKVPPALRSCHTARVGRYVVEGHMPADVIEDLLRQHPEVEGIAVPGMSAGSPGMESPDPVPYEVIAFDKDGYTSVFARR